MIEIALCLAIIGFALVSILLVLPSGMNTQRDTREETIIDEDAAVLMEAIRGGAHGMDDLTNYVYAITNFYQGYNSLGKSITSVRQAGYTYASASDNGQNLPGMVLTNGLRIIGLLSTPEFTTTPGTGLSPWLGGVPLTDTFGQAYTSNHIVAYVRSISGLAVEKPPQNNQIMQEDTFTYRVLCVNAPTAADTNMVIKAGFTRELAANLHELRLLFMWPQLPSGNVGAYRQNFRTSVAGQLIVTNYNLDFPNIGNLYFYQAESFNTNAP